MGGGRCKKPASPFKPLPAARAEFFPARHSPQRARQGEGGVEVHLMASRGDAPVSGKKAGPVSTYPAQPWPADAVERRPLASLTPSIRNARTHSPAQVAQLAASIREWGWTV